MENYTPEINYAPEGRNAGTSPTGTDTAKQVGNVLETQELKMQSRNLNYAQVGENLVTQLKEYLENAGVESMVMGVSGGVDSGLVSTLAAKTGMKLIVVEMPIHQASDEVDRAQQHIAWLKENYANVKSMEVNLTETFETLKAALPEIENEEVIRYMAYVNTRSRLRGDVLRLFANQYNGIVVGTGNKVEDYGIGFFTKGGDGDVDVSPIGNLYKSEVRALSRELGIDKEISEAVATDGLHTTGATDEDQIGATYDELEWAMVEYDEGKQVEDFSGRAAEVMRIYTTRHEGNAHKMKMPPVFTIEM